MSCDKSVQVKGEMEVDKREHDDEEMKERTVRLKGEVVVEARQPTGGSWKVEESSGWCVELQESSERRRRWGRGNDASKLQAEAETQRGGCLTPAR